MPLRVGGGSRLKILEALATGLPVVSTRIGAEGLSLDPGVHLDVVADVGGMAHAILAAMNDPQRAQAQADAARRRVLERYDWRPLAGKLAGVWENACEGRVVPDTRHENDTRHEKKTTRVSCLVSPLAVAPDDNRRRRLDPHETAAVKFSRDPEQETVATSPGRGRRFWLMLIGIPLGFVVLALLGWVISAQSGLSRRGRRGGRD